MINLEKTIRQERGIVCTDEYLQDFCPLPAYPIPVLQLSEDLGHDGQSLDWDNIVVG